MPGSIFNPDAELVQNLPGALHSLLTAARLISLSGLEVKDGEKLIVVRDMQLNRSW